MKNPMKAQLRPKIWLPIGAFLLMLGCTGSEPEPTITGYIEAEWRHLAAPQSGWLTTMELTEGDAISPGLPLFQLDATQQQAGVAQAQQNMLAAEAALADLHKGARPEELAALTARIQASQARLDLANTEQRRMQSLVKQGLINQEQLDQANTELAISDSDLKALQQEIAVAGLGGRVDRLLQAEAQVQAAAAQLTAQQDALAKRSVASTMTAVINEVHYHPGEFVPATAPVLTVRLTDQDKVRFHLSQAHLPTIKLGQSVQISADGLDQPLTAHISHISSSAEFTPPVIYSQGVRDKLVFLIEARLAAGQSLPPGLPVEVQW
ncbi:HlyD family secretion protein [Marinicella meishanensis]|uniref:HlyD family secretion protein n=1 Tax=Marinicella meishanensis TaxID=2873263 RepID=UPI001CC0B067|nr:HlyD family efflux transporter periplasmic adaptor subunit [Marinicella sp. NBU2979]